MNENSISAKCEISDANGRLPSTVLGLRVVQATCYCIVVVIPLLGASGGGAGGGGLKISSLVDVVIVVVAAYDYDIISKLSA